MRRTVFGAALLVAVAAGLTFTVVPLQGRQPTGPTDTTDEDGGRDIQRVERHIELLGDGAQIGVSIRDVEAGAAAAGAHVESVRNESPAAKAGLKDGDVITEFDGERVRSARQLSRLVSETPTGRTVPLKVARAGRQLDLQVTPEAAPLMRGSFEAPHVRIERMPHFRFEGPGEFERFLPGGDRVWSWSEGGGTGGRGRLGVGIQSLTPQLAEYFGAKEGVLVTTVQDDSPAAQAGLKAGDVITAIDGKTVASPRDLTGAVRETESAEVKISYVRDRKTADVQVKLPESEKKRERRTRSARPA
jgi:C-terminal processing protease CtpA/Prc